MKEKTTIEKINAAAEQLYAIELLEYHNKNFLASKVSPATWSEWKQCLLKEILQYCKEEDGAFGRAQV